MFLGVLNDDEKRAFTILAGRMIDADGIVVASELQALAALRKEMGLPESRNGNEHDVGKVASVFISRRSKIAALLELIGLGYSDANYSLGEESFVSSVAGTMGVSREELSRLDAWVRRHMQHVEAALAMMEGQARPSSQ